MSDFVIRDRKSGDLSGLRALWKLAFGDGDDYIESFERNLLQADGCIVAEADGKPVSAMYIVPGERLFPYRRNVLTAGYTYALATLPEYRRRGIGAAVYKAASDRVLRTSDVSVVRPAGPELFPFYENASGAKPLGGIREASLPAGELQGRAGSPAVRVPAGQYAGMREWFLSDMPHAVFPEALFDHLEETGTEFFMMENGAAAAETEHGVCRILELLAPRTDPMSAAAGVARWCRAQDYIVRTPLFFDGPGSERPFVLAAFNQTPGYPIPDDFWWGFALD